MCPGWKKAQLIFELLGNYGMSPRPLHPVLLTIGLHKDEAKNMKLPRACKHLLQAVWFSLQSTAEPCQAGMCDDAATVITGPDRTVGYGWAWWAKALLAYGRFTEKTT